MNSANMFAMALLFRSHRVVAITTILALMCWAMGLPSWINLASAAQLNDVSDTLSDSDLSADAEHLIAFELSALSDGLTGPATTTITFDPTGQAFDFTGVTTADVASSTTNAVVPNAGACTGGADADAAAEFYVGSVDTTNDFIEYVLCTSDTLSAGYAMDFYAGVTGGNDIANPASAGSYVIRVEAGTEDAADTRIAIIDDVTVTAAVDTTLTFTIAGVDADGAETIHADVLTGTSTATSVPFGTVSPGQAYYLAQDLAVTTNAANGFTVTVEADQTLTAGNGATIDEFVDASQTDVPTAWQAPAGTLDVLTTYGHWGFTSDDDLTVGGEVFDAGEYIGSFTLGPRAIFSHNGPADGSTADAGAARVGYALQISPLQEAANDYTATIWYVATPVF
jgi:hypothetical protein